MVFWREGKEMGRSKGCSRRSNAAISGGNTRVSGILMIAGISETPYLQARMPALRLPHGFGNKIVDAPREMPFAPGGRPLQTSR